MKASRITGVICTVLGGALGLWVITRLSSVAGRSYSWSPPFADYEAATLAVGYLNTDFAYGGDSLATPCRATEQEGRRVRSLPSCGGPRRRRVRLPPAGRRLQLTEDDGGREVNAGYRLAKIE